MPKPPKFLFVVLMCIQILIGLFGQESGMDLWSPQLSLEFADQLFAWQDYREAIWEYSRYLQLGADQAERAVLNMSLAYFRLSQYAKAAVVLDRHAAFFFDPARQAERDLLKAFALAELGHWESCYDLTETMVKDSPVASLTPALMVLRLNSLIATGRYQTAAELTETASFTSSMARDGEIAALRQALVTYKPKSLGLALVLSAFVPGAGKVYTGEWQDGLFSLVSLGSLGGMAAYNFYRDGPKAWKAWTYSAAFAAFYIANLYGSTESARRVNANAIKDIDNAITQLRLQYRP